MHICTCTYMHIIYNRHGYTKKTWKQRIQVNTLPAGSWGLGSWRHDAIGATDDDVNVNVVSSLYKGGLQWIHKKPGMNEVF